MGSGGGGNSHEILRQWGGEDASAGGKCLEVLNRSGHNTVGLGVESGIRKKGSGCMQRE